MPDVPGEWVAHCLDFDVITQGNSLPDAMAMVQEAATMVVLDDIEQGYNPADRRAPLEFWQEMYHALHGSQVTELHQFTEDPSFTGTVYVNLELAIHPDDPERKPDIMGIAMVV